MVFPGGGPIARHPSQLYEALCEGLLLFILLWSQRKKPWLDRGGAPGYWPHGSLLALLLVGYGFFRFIIEFTREPDPQLGLYFGLFSMGQILSAAMIVGGSILWLVRIQSARDGS
jgi:phosphatidylglycerol:prolipoprotein diacylglycerol transferase